MALKLGEIALLDEAARKQLAKQKRDLINDLTALKEGIDREGGGKGDKASVAEQIRIIGQIDTLEEDIRVLEGATDVNVAGLHERIDELEGKLELVVRERDQLLIETRDQRETIQAMAGC